jgi:hypothetical protein
MVYYSVSEYEDMFSVCTDVEIVRFAEHALAVADVLYARTRNVKFVAFETQHALNTNMRVLSALARALRGCNMPIRQRIVAALSSSINLFHK